MKKLLSIVLSLAMLSGVPVYAEKTAEDALAAVKARISIPSELTEFESESYKENGGTTYSFSWHDADYTASVEADCDENGRLSYYRKSNRSENDGEMRLSKYTAEDAEAFAEEFIRQTMPEVFGEKSDLVTIDKDGYISAQGARYYFTFNRTYNGAEVDGNYITVYVIAGDEEMSIQSMHADWDYDAEIKVSENLISDPNGAYKAEYPLNLAYVTDYENSDGEKTAVRLVYKTDGGYISAESGNRAEPAEETLYGASSGGSLKESATDTEDGAFTEEEKTELANIGELITEAEAEKILRAIPDLKMTAEMKLQSVNTFKDDDGYTVRVSFDDGKTRGLYASLDGKSGKIKSISNFADADYRNSENKEISAKKIAEMKKKADAFLEYAEPNRAKEFAAEEEKTSFSTVRFNYLRMVNGVSYADDAATVAYDAESGMLTRFTAPTYTEAEFADPSAALDANDVYDAFLVENPLKKVYIPISDKKYELCFTLSAAYPEIDAFTGETEKYEENGKYTDIDGHWCKEAAERLSDVGIYYDGTELKPNEAVTKGDILRLFAAGLSMRGYLHYADADITEAMAKSGVAEKSDANEPVLREDACVYMVRLAGFERVAKMSDIFNVNFADKDEISPEKTGYAAILSGMGVVVGDNGTLRPKDYITRAEAIQMLYVYLLP